MESTPKNTKNSAGHKNGAFENIVLLPVAPDMSLARDTPWQLGVDSSVTKNRTVTKSQQKKMYAPPDAQLVQQQRKAKAQRLLIVGTGSLALGAVFWISESSLPRTL